MNVPRAALAVAARACVLPLLLLAALYFLKLCDYANARDLGQWDATPGYVRSWFQNLMQPDQPSTPCCGESDAYWADSFEARGDQYLVTITDERDDTPLARPHRNPGEQILVPNNKIKWDAGNPTGHGILFVGGGGSVFCYVPGGGV